MTDAFDEFDDPGPLDGVKWKDWEGRLALVTPHLVKQMPNLDKAGELRDVTFADVVFLAEGGQEEAVFSKVPIFPKYLQGQLRANIGTGRSNLGRVLSDVTRQQPRQDAPWVLSMPTDADKNMARAYLRARAAAAATATSSASSQGYTLTASDAPPF